MGVDFSTMVYAFCFDFYGRPCQITPLKSQPGAGSYLARCIYHSMPLDVPVEGDQLISDQRTFLDIKMDEFAVLPLQGDHIVLPAAEDGPAQGPFEITDTSDNGGGVMMLDVKELVQAAPPPPLQVMPVAVLPFVKRDIKGNPGFRIVPPRRIHKGPRI